MVILTPDNWKQYKTVEANLKFSIDDIVMYDHGFTRFDENFGQVKDISKAGIIYVTEADLKMVRRNKLNHPAECQLAGWGYFDPKKFTTGEKTYRFIPRLVYEQQYNKKTDELIGKYVIKWHAPEGSGASNLRPIVLDKKGFVRAEWDGMD